MCAIRMFFMQAPPLNGDDIKATGGRVLAITSLQDNMFTPCSKLLPMPARIYYDGVYFRKDIGFDLL
jgi:phosphoribosylamine--glycine ligase